MVIEAQVMIGPEVPNVVQTIAARWSPKPEFQSWILFLVTAPDASSYGRLGILPPDVNGTLLFALMTDRSPVPQVLAAEGFQPWHSRGWNHVALSVDGSRISFYINGRYDSSFP